MPRGLCGVRLSHGQVQTSKKSGVMGWGFLLFEPTFASWVNTHHSTEILFSLTGRAHCNPHVSQQSSLLSGIGKWEAEIGQVTYTSPSRALGTSDSNCSLQRVRLKLLQVGGKSCLYATHNDRGEPFLPPFLSSSLSSSPSLPLTHFCFICKCLSETAESLSRVFTVMSEHFCGNTENNQALLHLLKNTNKESETDSWPLSL